MEELGYNKQWENNNQICYDNPDKEKYIYFNKNLKSVCCELYYDGSGDITMLELKEIIKILKELGWYE